MDEAPRPDSDRRVRARYYPKRNSSWQSKMAIPKDFDESLLLLGGKRQKVRNKRDVMVAGEVQRGVKKKGKKESPGQVHRTDSK